MDNCVTSVDCEEELRDFMRDATQIMADAKFELRGWKHTTLGGMENEPEILVVLGLLWDTQEDVLFCDVSAVNRPQGKLTRRSILSAAQRVYDPIGFCCPVTLHPKLLLQESWKAKLSWDAEVPEEISEKFMKWVEDLPTLACVKILKCVMLTGSQKYSLHMFCDACKTSCAAVIFLRSEYEGQVSVHLLQAKSRVAPLKQITIPRLELLACCTEARLSAFVKRGIDLEDVEYFWTDSSTVLHHPLQHADT
jgi:hypothetical protein